MPTCISRQADEAAEVAEKEQQEATDAMALAEKALGLVVAAKKQESIAQASLEAARNADAKQVAFNGESSLVSAKEELLATARSHLQDVRKAADDAKATAERESREAIEAAKVAEEERQQAVRAIAHAKQERKEAQGAKQYALKEMKEAQEARATAEREMSEMHEVCTPCEIPTVCTP